MKNDLLIKIIYILTLPGSFICGPIGSIIQIAAIIIYAIHLKK